MEITRKRIGIIGELANSFSDGFFVSPRTPYWGEALIAVPLLEPEAMEMADVDVIVIDLSRHSWKAIYKLKKEGVNLEGKPVILYGDRRSSDSTDWCLQGTYRLSIPANGRRLFDAVCRVIDPNADMEIEYEEFIHERSLMNAPALRGRESLSVKIA